MPGELDCSHAWQVRNLAAERAAHDATKQHGRPQHCAVRFPCYEPNLSQRRSTVSKLARGRAALVQQSASKWVAHQSWQLLQQGQAAGAAAAKAPNTPRWSGCGSCGSIWLRDAPAIDSQSIARHSFASCEEPVRTRHLAKSQQPASHVRCVVTAWQQHRGSLRTARGIHKQHLAAPGQLCAPCLQLCRSEVRTTITDTASN